MSPIAVSRVAHAAAGDRVSHRQSPAATNGARRIIAVAASVERSRLQTVTIVATRTSSRRSCMASSRSRHGAKQAAVALVLGEEHDDEAGDACRPGRAMASQVSGRSCHVGQRAGELALLLDLDRPGPQEEGGGRRQSPGRGPGGRCAAWLAHAFAVALRAAQVAAVGQDEAAGSSAYRPWRPRCSARRRAWRSSAARGPARLRLSMLVVDLVEEVRQRHLEDVGDLARIGTDGESRRHDADDRRDLVAGAGAIEVDRADRPRRSCARCRPLPRSRAAPVAAASTSLGLAAGRRERRSGRHGSACRRCAGSTAP